MSARNGSPLSGEITTGVPHRMPLGALFLLVTIFCFLVRGLTLLRVPPLLLAGTIFFAVTVAAGQALIDRGRRPRDASIMVGLVAFPFIFTLAFVFANGFDGSATIAALAWSTLLGPLLGYLMGVFLAGGFYLVANWNLRHRVDVAPETIAAGNFSPRDGQLLRHLRSKTALLRHPGWFLVTSVLLAMAPMLLFMPLTARYPRQMFLVSAGVGLCAGISQVRRIAAVLPVAALAAASIVAWQYHELPWISGFWRFGMVAWVLLPLGALLGLALWVLLGWLQLGSRLVGLPFRVGARSVGMVLLILALLTIGLSYAIHRERISPPTAILNTLRGEGMAVEFQYPASLLTLQAPPLAYVSVQGEDASSSLRQLSNHFNLSQLRRLSVADASLDAKIIVDFPPTRLVNLEVVNVSGDLSALADVAAPIRYLSVRRSAVDDEFLKRLAKNPQMSKSLRMLDFTVSRVTDEGLTQLKTLPRLQRLVLTGTSISGSGFAKWKSYPSMTWLGLATTELDSAAVNHIARIFPNLNRLDISGTKVDDGCSTSLLAMPSLDTLTVGESQLAAKSIRRLEAASVDVIIVSSSTRSSDATQE